MEINFIFFFNSILLGIGLATDAFSVSLANGLADHSMPRRKMFGVAGVFATFQALMPLIGWTCVHTLISHFRRFEPFIPWIALILLCYIGGNMIYSAITHKEEHEKPEKLGLAALLIQGIATSIDALSVGFTVAEYALWKALLSAVIIGAVTFVICMAGLYIGKRAGMKFAGKAEIFGGIILIFIGFEIFLTGVF